MRCDDNFLNYNWGLCVYMITVWDKWDTSNLKADN